MTFKHYYILFFLLSQTHDLTSQAKEPVSIRREAPHVIIFSMRPYEELPEFKEKKATQERLFQDPYWLTKKILNSKFSYATNPRGFHILFAGFSDTIDVNREARFPRYIQEDEIQMIITRKLIPVVIRGNTVEYFLHDTNYDIAYYTLKRMHDPEKNIEYWNVEKKDIPQNKKIPASALIIFAEPNEIIVPTGKTIATGGPNLVLPPIYTNEKTDKDYNALSFIKINRYFDPIEQVTKIAPPQRYAQKIGNGTR